MAASAVVVCRIVAAADVGGFGTKVQPRLAHNLAGCNEFAETFLVGKGVAGTERSPTAARRRCSQKVL